MVIIWIMIRTNCSSNKLRKSLAIGIFTLQHSGNTALTLSCQREDLNIVCTLLKLGANPNVCTQVSNCCVKDVLKK